MRWLHFIFIFIFFFSAFDLIRFYLFVVLVCIFIEKFSGDFPGEVVEVRHSTVYIIFLYKIKKKKKNFQ